MKKLHQQLNELESNISKQDFLNKKISKSNVGWHIEHSLLTINLIFEQVKKSNPSKYRWSFKLPRLIVFAMNKIPRGRAKSPDIVVPKIYDTGSLLNHLQITKENVAAFPKLDSGKFFNHPYFGNLQLKQTIKFLEIHTNHHLEIINDIIKDA